MGLYTAYDATMWTASTDTYNGNWATAGVSNDIFYYPNISTGVITPGESREREALPESPLEWLDRRVNEMCVEL